MKLIKTQDAVGQVLCHDLTRIIPGVEKGPAFRKGHIVTEEDIPVLLSMGKQNLYIWEKSEGILHEDEAAEILYDMCKNDNIERSAETKERSRKLIEDLETAHRIHQQTLVLETITVIVIIIRSILIVLQSRGLI